MRSLLEKSAYEAIAGLTLSSANYHEAIEILKKRFGNRPSVSGEHDLRGLCHLYNEVETNVRSLKALGVDQDSYGTMLASVLLTKLPTEIRLIVSRKVTGDNLDLETLQCIFEEELTARERSRDPTKSGRHPQDKSRPPPTATTLLSESSRRAVVCCYCQQPHPAANCSVVTTLDSRKQIFRTSGRCFNCLAKGHIGRRCRLAPQCHVCKRKHHTSICDHLPSTDLANPSSSTRTYQCNRHPIEPSGYLLHVKLNECSLFS